MKVYKQNGYVLIITLLMLVALTVAGMGAMLMATTDISLSGNQRVQISAKSAALTGVNAGMATLCSHPFNSVFAFASSAVKGTVFNPTPSQPRSGFYNGLYNTPMPSSVSGSYSADYFTSNAESIPNPSLSMGLGGGTGSAINTFSGQKGSKHGSFYKMGPIVGIVGNKTKVECERTVYYGLP